jgi:cytochrome c2
MLTIPLVAWSVHAVALWVWHAPPLFQATLQSELIHTLQHLSFLLSALLFWWAVLHGGRGWMGYGAATLYVFTTSIHSGALGALLTFSSTLWYPAYRTSAAWGLTPLEDQQLGGLLMWIPAGLAYLFAGLVLIAGWLRQTEARAQQRRRYQLHPPAAPRPKRNAVAAPGMVFSLLTFTSCERNNMGRVAAPNGGDIERGRQAIRHYGCPACHTIPGVPGADGLVGPPLAGIASRVYLGGTVPNTAENMVRWIQRPQDIAPRTTMPNIPMSEREARDIAGYLYTLR